MTNSRAAKNNRLELLDQHLATGTEATYTYTPGTALDMKSTYREVQIIITGQATAALGLLLKVNAQTDYDTAVFEHDSASLSGGLSAAAATHEILGNALIDGASSFNARITLVCNDANDTLMILALGSAPHEGTQIRTGDAQAGSTTTITSIEIKTSTSTWIAGTEITIYGLKR